MCDRHNPHNPHCATCLADAPTESIFDWRAWAGGEMPVPPDVLIEVKRRSGWHGGGNSQHFGWLHAGTPNDVVSYRLVEPIAVYNEHLLAATEAARRARVTPVKHSHYFKDVSKLQTIDVYRVLSLFNVTDPCLQHAVKKLLVAGGRGGGKPIDKDVQEAIDTLQRWQGMRAEEVAS